MLIEAAGRRLRHRALLSRDPRRRCPDRANVGALYTDMVVREDLMQLFGFRTLTEREWHRLLISVQGVGAKVSLAILGTLGIGGAD